MQFIVDQNTFCGAWQIYGPKIQVANYKDSSNLQTLTAELLFNRQFYVVVMIRWCLMIFPDMLASWLLGKKTKSKKCQV
jgi:hypothetical protein